MFIIKLLDLDQQQITSKKFSFKVKFCSQTPLGTSDFERRKLAEQRATKRLKSDNEKDKKTKLGPKKER